MNLVIFTDNQANGGNFAGFSSGGALYVYSEHELSNSSLVINDSTFHSNNLTSGPYSYNSEGGGVTVYAGTIMIYNTSIIGNIHHTEGCVSRSPGDICRTGGLSCTAPYLLSIINCTIANNTLEGPENMIAGGLYANTDSTKGNVIISNTFISGNKLNSKTLSFGAGLILDTLNATLDNVTLSKNIGEKKLLWRWII